MKKKTIYQHLISCLALLAAMFFLSFLLLSLLSFLSWKMDGNVKLVSGGIIAIYILVNVFGGFVMGNIFGKQKFFWGLLTGIFYFAVLLLAGMLFAGTTLQENSRIFPGFMICMAAGMFGGMLSPGRAGKK